MQLRALLWPRASSEMPALMSWRVASASRVEVGVVSDAWRMPSIAGTWLHMRKGGPYKFWWRERLSLLTINRTTRAHESQGRCRATGFKMDVRDLLEFALASCMPNNARCIPSTNMSPAPPLNGVFRGVSPPRPEGGANWPVSVSIARVSAVRESVLAYLIHAYR